MIAIFQREFKSYFSNMIGYVVTAVLTFFFGYAYCVYNVSAGYPYFGIALSVLTVYLLILTPLITMRSLSEEKKTKTDQMLLTAPISVTKVIMGKFLAMMAVLGVPMLISCIFPLLLLQQTYHNLLIDYCCIFAYYLMGGAFIAIGMFISSLTESQIIAAVLSFAVYYLMTVMESLTSYIPETSIAGTIGFCLLAFIIALIIYRVTKNFYASFICFLLMAIAVWAIYFIDSTLLVGTLATVLNAVSFTNGISYFANGIFNVTDIVFSLSIIIIFVFLTVQSVQKRRWN